MSILAWWKRSRASKRSLELHHELLRLRREYLEIIGVPDAELVRLAALGVISQGRDQKAVGRRQEAA